MERINEWSKELWCVFENLINNTSEENAISILSIIITINIFIVIIIGTKWLLEIIKKTHRRIKLIRDDTAKYIENKKIILESCNISSLVEMTDFYKLPDNLLNQSYTNYKFLFSTGIMLLFPNDIVNVLFGKERKYVPKQDNIEVDGTLKIELKEIIFCAEKLTRITLAITNIGTESQRFTMTKKKLKEKIKLLVNENDKLEYENTNEANFLEKGSLEVNDTKNIQFSFYNVDKNYINNIKDVKIDIEIAYQKKIMNFVFKYSMESLSLKNLNIQYEEFNLEHFIKFLSYGGFISIIYIFQIVFIIFLKRYINLIILIAVSVPLLIYTVNLNYKLISLVLKIFTENNEKNSNK